MSDTEKSLIVDTISKLTGMDEASLRLVNQAATVLVIRQEMEAANADSKTTNN